MKTSDLIRRLQEEDPTGDAEVCIGKYDIHFVSRQPSYYDGYHTILVRDASKTGYNITGAIINYVGVKIKLHVMDAEDVIDNNPDAPVEVRGSSSGHMVAQVEAWRKEARDSIAEADTFVANLKKQGVAGGS